MQLSFQLYHLMVAIGMALIALAWGGGLLAWRGMLFRHRWMLWILVFSVLLPQLANQLGWGAAEVGRQPWIVYGLMRTADGVSDTVDAPQRPDLADPVHPDLHRPAGGFLRGCWTTRSARDR